MPIEMLTSQLVKFILIFLQVGGIIAASRFFGSHNIHAMLQIYLIGITALILMPVALSNRLYHYGKLATIMSFRAQAETNGHFAVSTAIAQSVSNLVQLAYPQHRI